ncbi:JAB domain-containing protein [uncultured Winogradskyella sp.]|uniref:JAB domain-containing protein n=1 Tax=uncultured Winogradskyella sp. TaxID=395353 RepID=UPI00260B49D8|nr:JAB domain-containing protein [uncultured Winogradskyella sp.]
MNLELPSINLLGSSEIELHYKRPLFNTMVSITCAEDADKALRSCINLKQLDLKECFWLITLTTAHRLIGISESTVGNTGGVIVSTKEILQIALKANASRIIVAHSHPSGNLKISDSDKTYTDKLKKACKLLDIELLDHLILTSESFLSLAYEKVL